MLVAGCFFLAPQVLAQEPPRITIVGPGSQLSAIAISELKNLGGDESHKLADEFVSILSRDLKLSGYFRIINTQAYIEDPQRSGFRFNEFNWGDWSSIGAEFLVKGGINVGDDRVTVEVLLFDVGQHRQLVGKRFTGPLRGVARMARRFADAILEATTGERGPFDTRIAMSSLDNRFKEVFTMSVDGRDLFRVTNNQTINILPSFSRDPNQLLYLSYKTGEPALFLADLARRTEISITNPAGKVVGGALSPDGRRIAAALESGGSTDLYLLDLKGNVIRRLTHTSAINVDPAFSPDGRMLAFTSDRSGTPQIYLMSLDGGKPRRLTFRGTYNTSPAISPKGGQIAYESRIEGHFDIFVIPIDGGDPIRLTHGEGNNQNPAWSPDGRYLVFSSTRSGRSKLYLMLVETGKVIASLTEGNYADTNPAWSWWLTD